MEKLVFQGKDGDSAEFYVLEQTRMSGVNYLLVTDSEEDDGECLILKDTSEDQDQESPARPSTATNRVSCAI